MSIKSKTEFKWRWAILLMCSLSISTFSFTSQDLSTQHDAYKQYFSDQIPSDQFDFYFQTLYSSALFVVIFLDVYVGSMADLYGPGKLFIIQAFFITSGQFIFFSALRYKIFYMLYIGRFLIYASNSTTLVSNSIMIAQYFAQKEMGLSSGIATTLGVLGVACNLQLAPLITEKYSLVGSSFITFCLTLVAFVTINLVCYIDRTLAEQIRQNGQIKTARRQSIKAQNFWQELKSLPKSYWYFNQACYLSNVCGTMVGIIGPAFLSETYNMTAAQAGRIASLLPIASISVPFIGKIVDLIGKPITWMIVSGILNSIGCYGLTQFEPTAFYFIFGMSYAIRIAITMSVITLIVSNSQRGKAFGLIRSFRDVSGFLFTFINGYLHNKTGSYKSSLLFYACLGVIVTIFAFLSNWKYNQAYTEAEKRRETRKLTITQRKSTAQHNSLTQDQVQKLQQLMEENLKNQALQASDSSPTSVQNRNVQENLQQSNDQIRESQQKITLNTQN